MKLVVALTVLMLPTALYAQCLSYRDRAEISGVLSLKTFPGPPNFESVAKGDKKDVSYVLKPAHALCVDALSKDPDEIDVAVKDVRLVQLVTSQNSSRLLKPLFGTTVTVSGSLIGAVSGWHHTPVLLSNIKLVQDANNKR